MDVTKPPPINDIPFNIKQDFLRDVYAGENAYNTLVGLIERKEYLILQGAPGVANTFAAKRLAYSMMGVNDTEQVMMIQFYQSCTYNDFIMRFMLFHYLNAIISRRFLPSGLVAMARRSPAMPSPSLLAIEQNRSRAIWH